MEKWQEKQKQKIIFGLENFWVFPPPQKKTKTKTKVVHRQRVRETKIQQKLINFCLALHGLIA